MMVSIDQEHSGNRIYVKKLARMLASRQDNLLHKVNNKRNCLTVNQIIHVFSVIVHQTRVFKDLGTPDLELIKFSRHDRAMAEL